MVLVETVRAGAEDGLERPAGFLPDIAQEARIGCAAAGRLFRLHAGFRLDRFGTLACMAVNLALLLSAAVGKHITWRGIRYRLDGPHDTVRLN